MGMGEWEATMDDTIICRCMEVTVKEVVEAIRLGADSFDAVKRMTRAGMGLCQGRTCQHLIERLITEETGLKTGELQPISIRPPLRPTALKDLAGMTL
jgi:NAD(P)H-nitrite reductase large subunit